MSGVSADAGEDAGDVVPLGEFKTYLHVGLMYFSPYRPTSRQCMPAENGSLDDGDIVLDCLHCYLTNYEVAYNLYLYFSKPCNWTVSVMMARSSSKPQLTIRPSQLVFGHVSDDREFSRHWPKPKRQK